VTVADSGSSPSAAADPTEHRSPFRGLGFYTEADAKWFFGRMTERKIILAHLRTARLTLLYAESGVGKSSLLRAGVAARLRELAQRDNGAARSPRFLPVVFSAWKDEPVKDLIAEIERQVSALIPDADRPVTLPNGNGNGSNLAAAITGASSALNATLVIILDQFEEHLSYRTGAATPDRLADELAHCINSPDVRANFLIAVREDAYGRLGDLFGGRIGNVYGNYLHLEYLTRDAGRDAIEQPVAVYNSDHPAAQPMALEDDLVDAVLEEVRRGNLELGARRPDRDGASTWLGMDADAIETPFLQLVMSRMWEWEREHGSLVLRRATLDGELGGAEAIVRNHVSHALAGLAGEELEAATDFFGALVTPSGVKVAHTAADLAQMTGHAETTVASAVRRLYEERILRAVDPAPGTTQARYEIFHDRLAAPIVDWREQQENARLKRAALIAERDAETQRVQARRFKRRARVMLALALGLLILLVAVVVLLQYARDQSATAKREQRAALRDTRAATSFALTTRADSALASRPDVSLLLDLAAYANRPQAIAARSVAATLETVAESSGAAAVLSGHTGAVESVAFSPATGLLASAGSDKTIRFWQATGGAHYPLGRPLRADTPLYSAAFAPDGRTLASGGFDKVILWNVLRRAKERVLPYDGGAVTSVAFSRRGHVFAAGGANGTVLLWNPATGAPRVVPVPGGGEVRSVALSPNGNVLAVGISREVVLLDVARGRALGRPLNGPTGSVYAVAFSPDGRTVAAAGNTGEVALWNPVSRGRGLLVAGGRNPINSLAFSPSGQALAAGGDGTTAVWSLTSHRQLANGEPLSGHRGAVYSVAFSPDGALLASGGADGTIVLWRYPVGPRFGIPLVVRNDAVKSVAISPDGRLIASGDHGGAIWVSRRSGGPPEHVLRAHAGQVEDLRFDPAGGLLAAAYADGTIGLWDVATGTSTGRRLRGDVGGAVHSIAFNQTGTMLASGGSSGSVRLWDMHSRTQLGRPLAGNVGTVYAVALSSDGATVAAAGTGRVIRLWDTQTHAPLHPPLIAEDDTVFSLAFAPHGRLLAAGGADDTIHLWSIGRHTDTLVRTFTGDSGYIRSVAFSPDGTTLASGSTDSTARLWDVATGAELGGPLPGDTRSVEKVVFSRDGDVLVTGSADRTVRLWHAVPRRISSAALRAEVCGFVGAGLSGVEWSEYAPGIPFRRTCPRTTSS
jgi:WD40 repeat protein